MLRTAMVAVCLMMASPTLARDGAPMTMAEWRKLDITQRTEVVAALTSLMYPERAIMDQVMTAVNINQCLLGFAKPSQGTTRGESDAVNAQMTVVKLAVICAARIAAADNE